MQNINVEFQNDADDCADCNIACEKIDELHREVKIRTTRA